MRPWSIRSYKRLLVSMPLLCVPIFLWRCPDGCHHQRRRQAMVQHPANRQRTIHQSNRLLIAQYTGGGDNNRYTALLNLTSPVNQLYAQTWGYQYELVTGYLIQQDDELLANEINFPESRSIYNKVILLERAVREKYYDLLLLLDSDAMLFDFSRDIASLMMNDTTMLVAHKVHRADSNHTGNINNGVTLWNLRHPATSKVAQRWKEKCLIRIRNQTHLRDDDQTPLQSILQKELTESQRRELILALSDQLGYGKGQFVKHFIRHDAKNWTHTGLERRATKIRKAIQDICKTHFAAHHRPTTDLCRTSLSG